MPSITSFYAGLLALLFLALSARVITYRRTHRLSLGDTGDKALLKRMRTQANCAEYTPIAIILILILELGGATPWLLHALGGGFLLGRLLHAYGLGSTPQNFLARQAGMILTLMVIAISAAMAVVFALF
ncbi:MAG: MAPEG family protein [Pseudoruegeria sp.]